MEATANPVVPRHLWIVGALALLWNSFGCFDYLMTQTANQAYLSQFTAEERAAFTSMPAWADAVWALGVWGALAGSVLLLLRSRHAVTAFAASLIGLALGTLYSFGFADMPDSLRTPGMLAMNLIIWAAAIFFLYYALRMRTRGVLL